MSAINNLPLRLRLIGLCLFLSLISLIPLYALFEDLRVSWFFNDHEQRGITPANTLVQTIAQVQRHRGLSGPWLQNNEGTNAARLQAAEGLEQQWRTFEAQWQDTDLDEHVLTLAKDLHRQSVELVGQVTQRQIASEESFRRHTELIDKMLCLMFEVAASSNLLYDPEEVPYLMIISGFQEGPRVTELAARVRGLGTSYLASPTGMSQNLQLAQDTHGRLLERLGSLEAHLKAAARRQADLQDTLVGPALNKLEDLRRLSNETRALLEGDTESQLSSMTSQAYFEHASRFIDAQTQVTTQVTERVVEALAARQHGIRVKVVILGIVIVALIGFGLWLMTTLIRGILKPVHRMKALAESLAEGDLTRSCATHQRDEIGDCMNALETARQSWVQILHNVRKSVDMVSSASIQIAVDSEDLHGRTVSAAASLEETSTAIYQLTSTVEQTADSAQQANDLAFSASETARQGQDVMTQAVHNMDTITTASQRIADIIGVIDSIAFQTNILALNAAVEAARAGESGRGFAVVASEVRSLAQRSAQSAREIKSLINDSLTKIENGTQLVHNAGANMQAILDSNAQVSRIIGAISHATKEQSVGFSQVNQATQQLDGMTSSNAALVEQSTEAAHRLRVEAERLMQMISVFKFEHTTQGQWEVAETPRALGAARTPQLSA